MTRSRVAFTKVTAPQLAVDSQIKQGAIAHLSGLIREALATVSTRCEHSVFLYFSTKGQKNGAILTRCARSHGSCRNVLAGEPEA